MILGILVCFIPLVLAAVICLKAKKLKPKLLFAAVLTGLIAIIPAAAAQFALGQLVMRFFAGSGAAVFLLIANGCTEECIRALILRGCLPSKQQTAAAFFAAACIAGLSFGSFEAVIYFIAGSQHIGLRLFTAVILHCSCSGLCGLFIWGQKTGSRRPFIFIQAAAIHSVYNFFASFSNFIWYFSIAAILFSVAQCSIFYKYFDGQKQTSVDTLSI
ncbi:MAG: PrsW family glutamic-type intramembrane protease [Bacteroides sp.]|nr:PrsW family glutamic-type intramembrane protease [Prevotella sp.]MCM1407973.1 PrsW family glutamic-type intramembrane protease [Treponema brennaborense]MCM1468949.1 PrsW family glutamic-type intramembrane protease [Bacteroides sp.]